MKLLKVVIGNVYPAVSQSFDMQEEIMTHPGMAREENVPIESSQCPRQKLKGPE